MKRSYRRMSITAGALTCAAILTACGAAAHNTQSGSEVPTTTRPDAPPTTSGYSELLEGEIRGIDAETLDGYLTGKGLGYALPAELNGYPGPRHVLDAIEELELTEEQESQIQALFDDMETEAIDLGEQIVKVEAELETAFRNKDIDNEALQSQLEVIGDLDTKLRFVHLSTHLTTIEILTDHQVVLYNTVRGYANTPQSHDHSG